MCQAGISQRLSAMENLVMSGDLTICCSLVNFERRINNSHLMMFYFVLLSKDLQYYRIGKTIVR
jgi:hypothetical protein